MKTNNIAKRIGIASLCLGLVSAFSGITSFNNNVSFFGEAEDTTVALTELVTVSEGATVKHDLDAASGTNAQGLRITSDVAYSATFNTLFNGNSVFKFRFPETYDETVGYYGDFKFHIEDATDPDNCFDIVYYTRTTSQTGVYVQWKDEIRAVKETKATNTTYLNKQSTGTTYYAPAFLSQIGSGYGTREGVLALVWNNGVLGILQRSVQNSTAAGKGYMNVVARFDGTYAPTTSTKGLSGINAMGLPKLSFPNGYKVTISSNLENDDAKPEGLTDNATDVVFREITTDATKADYTLTGGQYIANWSYSGGQTSTLTSASITEFTKDNYMQAYDKITDSANAGKALLGWKDAEGALYPTTTALKSTDISAYAPVFLGFDTINGASVRIESAEGGKSGIRFMTIFDVEDYAAAKSYLTSFGTLITYTDTLNTVKKEFTIANYAGEATFAQVKNTKSVFTYNDKSGNQYKAYSMALVDIQNYAKEYSARGYLEVTYADETTQIIYTDYNAADNSRSVAKVAWLLKTQDSAAYEAMSEARQALVDSYAEAYVVPEE